MALCQYPPFNVTRKISLSKVQRKWRRERKKEMAVNVVRRVWHINKTDTQLELLNISNIYTHRASFNVNYTHEIQISYGGIQYCKIKNYSPRIRDKNHKMFGNTWGYNFSETGDNLPVVYLINCINITYTWNYGLPLITKKWKNHEGGTLDPTLPYVPKTRIKIQTSTFYSPPSALFTAICFAPSFS